MSHREYLFPVWIRLWHWTNALLIIGLIITGGTLHFSAAKVVDFKLARDIHNLFGITLCIAWLVFFVGNIVTGNWRQFVPRLSGFFGRTMLQVRYYLVGIFRNEPRPFPPTREQSFNPLQQTAYLAIMYLVMPVLLVSGALFLFPEVAPKRVDGMDGLIAIALVHFIVGFLILVFVLAHIYMCTCGTKITSDFKAMITGWEEE